VRRVTTVLLFIGYVVGVLAVAVFPTSPNLSSYWDHKPWRMIHYIPFAVDAPSFLLNIIMFMPFGVLVPLLWPRADSYRRVFGYALAASMSIEAIQLILDLTIGTRRTVDINDLIANTAGAVAGLLVLRLAVPEPARRAAIVRTPVPEQV
jgi:glycopeptide antibiotics resistance protein